MRILLVIRKMMVPAMDGHPQSRGELQGTRSEHRKRAFKPAGAREAAMRDEPMEPKVETQDTEGEHPDPQESQSS